MGSGAPRERADRSQLQQIIAGLTDGVILLDPDQRLVWANQAALTMHGVERLEELGATVAEYRARFELRYRNSHKLAGGDYPIDRVLAGEVFSEVVVEVAPAGGGKPDWVHQVRSLILKDAAGGPQTLVLILRDVSEQVDAVERFEQAFNANPAPAVICRLADLRYVRVNRGFLEMTGHVPETILGRSAYEFDVLAGGRGRELALEQLREGRTIPQMEAQLRLPGGGSKPVIVAGQPIEIGDEGCMLFTFVDLESRRRVEAGLWQTEERLATVFRLAPVPMMVSTADTLQLIDLNDAFVAVTGHAPEDAIGYSAAELGLWATAGMRTQVEKALRRGEGIRGMDVQVQVKGGDLLGCLLSTETILINDQPCILGILQEITERRRSEVELIEAIDAVMQDTSWFSRTVIEKLAELRRPHGANRVAAQVADLTARERDVLGLICRGLSDPEIAAELRIAHNTVRNQVAAIYAKLDVHRRSDAIIWARDRGFGDKPGGDKPGRGSKRK